MVRYTGNYQYMLKWDIEEFIEQVETAYKKKQDDILLSRWMINYETQMPYDEFISHLGIGRSNNKKQSKPMEEVLNMANQIINNSLQRG